MRFRLLPWLIFLSPLAGAQQSNGITTEIVKFQTTKGHSIKVSGRPPKYGSDTAQLIIESIVNGRTKEIQRFKTKYSFPLKISLAIFNRHRGITVQYDPMQRYGNAILYLYDEKISKMRKIENFERLGNIDSFFSNRKNNFYSYISCGCADNCWKSVLFEIRSFKIDTVGYLHCDCNNLIEKVRNQKNKSLVKPCTEFNDDYKFSKIRKYWIRKVKNGL